MIRRWKLKHALQMWTWCFDFEIRVKWWSIGPQPPPIDSLFLSSTPSPGNRQQQRKQPKNNTDTLPQKLYRLYTNWFKAHNRISIYQSHTKPFYVQYHPPERFCPSITCHLSKCKIYMTKSGQDATKWNSRRILPRLFSLGTKWNHSKMTCEWKNLSHNFTLHCLKKGLGAL